MPLFDDSVDSTLNWLFGGGSPASFDLAVSSTEPDSDGTNITEPTGGDYARVNIANNSTNFPSSSGGGAKVNGTTFLFPTATDSWGAALAWWILFDHVSGDPVIWGALSPSKTIASGDALRILAGQMSITMS